MTEGSAAKELSMSTTCATARVAELPLPSGEPDVRILEGEDVIDPVSNHRHHMAACLEGPDERPLLLRRDPPEDGAPFRQIAQPVGVARQVTPVHW